MEYPHIVRGARQAIHDEPRRDPAFDPVMSFAMQPVSQAGIRPDEQCTAGDLPRPTVTDEGASNWIGFYYSAQVLAQPMLRGRPVGEQRACFKER